MSHVLLIPEFANLRLELLGGGGGVLSFIKDAVLMFWESIPWRIIAYQDCNHST